MRSRAGRCAATASQIKVEAQGEEKLEDLLDLGGAERPITSTLKQSDQMDLYILPLSLICDVASTLHYRRDSEKRSE